MKIREKVKLSDIIFLIIIAIFAILALLKLNNELSFNKFNANINEYESVEVLKLYDVGNIVYFDPVNYRLCDTNEANTCYKWIVTSKNQDSYNLFYIGKDENMKWTKRNPAEVINDYTQNWSDNLTVDESYKYSINENYKYNFTKARMLTVQEYSLLDDINIYKTIVGDVTNGPRYAYLLLNPSYNGNELDPDASYFASIGQAGQFGTDLISYNTITFRVNAENESNYNNDSYIRPLINIDINNVGNNKKLKYNISYRSFNKYDTIDFDPVNYRFCDDDYESDTCYRWVVINKNDNEYDLYFYDSIDSMLWTKKNPVDVIEEYTANWSSQLKIGSNYDVRVNDEYGYYFNEKKARMLTDIEYNSFIENNIDYRKQVADYKKLNLIISPSNNKFYLTGPYTDYTDYSNTMYDLKGEMSFSYVNNSFSNFNISTRTYIKPVIHVNIEYGIDNVDEKERESYTCRRATKNITLGQINTKGELKTGDAFDCNVDGTGFNKRFYYVTDLDDNEEYGVLIYNHSIKNGDVYDLSCYLDNSSNASVCNSFAYDVDNDPQVNGPKTAINQLPTISNWNTRLYNTTRNILDNGGNVRIENFSYEGKAARLLTLQEIIKACDLSNTFKYSDMDNNDSTLPDKCSFLLENLDRDNTYSNSRMAYDYWLENVINKDETANIGLISTYASSWIISTLWDNIYTRPSYEANNSTGIRPVIEVKKSEIDYIDYVKVTFNDEERITEKEIAKGSATDAVESQGKTNYTFKYWSTTKEGSAFNFEESINEDITLYAVYEIDRYTISYELNGGSLEEGKTNPTSYTPESDNILLNNPYKEGYTFTGWTGSNGQEPMIDVTILKGTTGNKEYTANYEINKYDVEFYLEDELLSTQKVNERGKINQDHVPKIEKTGYIFKGWKEKEATNTFDLETEITRNYKLYAIVEKMECTLSLKSNIYKIDEEKKEINNVPENEETEVIRSNIVVEGTIKEITKEYVTITCDEKTKTYKINRIWIPKTGNLVARGAIIFGYSGIILTLLFIIGKQVDKNKRLRSRL